MCGLAGYLDSSRRSGSERLREVAASMSETLRHRGPDDAGVWVDAEAGIALGHRRLSILDLSPEGHQPMISADGGLVAVLNGEIYNFQELRKELEALGHRFRGRSDTEVMLAAFSQWGVEPSLRRFNGMFALGLWNRRERSLTLARDRFGKKPLYYGWAGRSFVFGSELKALCCHPEFQAEMDRGALALYLRHGYIPAPYSIYEGIRKLTAGSYLTLRVADGAGAEPGALRYWPVEEAFERGLAAPHAGSVEELLEELRALLEDAVRIRMIADVPLGAFLSGGIDSSVVVALMQGLSGRPVKTFAIGFREQAFDEAAYASAVARRLGTEHTELYVSPGDAMAVVPLLPAMFDEPFADSSQIPTYLVSRLARSEVTVSLSGDGGDELFGGYQAYLVNSRAWSRYGRIPRAARVLLGRAVAGVPARRWDGILRRAGVQRENAGWRFRRLGLALAQPTPALFYRDLISQWERPAELLPGVAEPATVFGKKAETSRLSPELMMGVDAAVYLPDDVLVKVDRASMAVSLEARAPLLDYRVAEFAWRVPVDYKIREGEGKWLLRQLAYRLVPRQLLDRPKSGFAVPVGEWIRGPLRHWAEDLMAATRREGILEAGPVTERWEAHREGRADWSAQMWNVLMLQAWVEKVRDRSSGTRTDCSPILRGRTSAG
ncbi:MAG: asparagine synthase (glutamine-hydrolyzing) [Bryobacterales bacterium]|nr:asparagine synthase (glutamine-hydrolyzing) [Bryobacterales bacterium]